MKKTVVSVICVVLSLVFVLCFPSCQDTDNTDPWDNATYQQDTEFGEGKTTVQVEVKVEEHSVTFTIHTDKTTLGDALIEHNLIEGEDGPYGLYIKVVNGITADADSGNYYWGFYKNGEYMMSGADTTEIADGEHYEIVYERI